MQCWSRCSASAQRHLPARRPHALRRTRLRTLTGYEHTRAVGKSAMELGMWDPAAARLRGGSDPRQRAQPHPGASGRRQTLGRRAHQRRRLRIEGDQLIVVAAATTTPHQAGAACASKGDAILDSTSVGIALMRGEHDA